MSYLKTLCNSGTQPIIRKHFSGFCWAGLHGFGANLRGADLAEYVPPTTVLSAVACLVQRQHWTGVLTSPGSILRMCREDHHFQPGPCDWALCQIQCIIDDTFSLQGSEKTNT